MIFRTDRSEPLHRRAPRIRQRERNLQTPHSLIRAEDAGDPTRIPVPTEIRRVLGRRVECQSNLELQYDHVLSVVLRAFGFRDPMQPEPLLAADCTRRSSP
jgi:hypothetical protein